VAWLQQALAGKVVAVSFAPYAGSIDGQFGPVTEASVKALQSWANAPPTGVVDDASWFVWLTPGSAQQLTLEVACGLLSNL
jgi:peptidoglycan hydrolase-like protein with peptidoglycan-binding domain